MKQSFIRYLPLLLLAVAWEVVARLELVSPTALPPLSDVIAAWVDMIKDGELITNGASSLYRAGAGLALSIIIGTLLGIGMAWWKAKSTPGGRGSSPSSWLLGASSSTNVSARRFTRPS